MLDGAGPIRTLISVILPQSWPVVITVALLHFFYMWNETRQAALYLSTRRDLVPISFGISNFQSLAPMQNQLQSKCAAHHDRAGAGAAVFAAPLHAQSRCYGCGEISHAHQTNQTNHCRNLAGLGDYYAALFCAGAARFKVERPDRALFWTAAATAEGGAQDNKHYLQDPFLQAHVAWDSEYYLAIALDGYEAPYIERVGTFVGSTGGPRYWPFVIPGGADGVVSDGFSLSYAFSVLSTADTDSVRTALSLLGLTALGTAALAGVIMSLLGALAASLAMFELGKDELGESGGLRAVYYLLIFPSAFFMSVVYTEGLFLGLAFSSLLLTRRGHLGWAALLAVLATYTRAVGVALFIPLLIAWVRDGVGWRWTWSGGRFISQGCRGKQLVGRYLSLRL